MCPIRAFNIYVNKVNGSGRHSGKVPLWKQDIADLTELFNGVVTDSFKFVNLREKKSGNFNWAIAPKKLTLIIFKLL